MSRLKKIPFSRMQTLCPLHARRIGHRCVGTVYGDNCAAEKVA